MVLSTGLEEIVGELIGENLGFSEYKCIEIIMELKKNVHGVQLNQSHIMLKTSHRRLKAKIK